MENKKEIDKNIKFLKYINILILIIIFGLGFRLIKRYYFREFYYKVPSVLGFELDEAKKVLNKTNLNIRNMGEIYSDIPYGKVAKQEPVADKIVKKERNIKIWLSKNRPVIFLENLIGMNYVEASFIAKREGLIIERIEKIDSDYPINQVIATSPKSGEPIVKGEKISFIVSTGNN